LERAQRGDLAQRRQLFQHQCAFVLNAGVVFRQLLGVEVDQLREEDVGQDAGVGQAVRRHAR
jgi:hypothetical protein